MSSPPICFRDVHGVRKFTPFFKDYGPRVPARRAVRPKGFRTQGKAGSQAPICDKATGRAAVPTQPASVSVFLAMASFFSGGLRATASPRRLYRRMRTPVLDTAQLQLGRVHISGCPYGALRRRIPWGHSPHTQTPTPGLAICLLPGGCHGVNNADHAILASVRP
jgi:hypothetical protein